MKKIGLGILGVCLTLSSLAMHKKIKNGKNKTQIAATSNPTRIKSLLMGRAGCYGTCPIYTLEIFDDGRVVYTGKRYVDKIGIFEKKLSAQSNLDLFKSFNEIRPDTLYYQYETRIADLPGFYYFINYGDSIKRVINADAGPKILRDWANKIDEYAPIDDSWKKIGTEE